MGCLNSYVKHFNKYGTIGFNSATLVFSYNSMQSVFHGLKWSWQDHFTLQVGKVVEKYQSKESSSFRLKLGKKNVPIIPTMGFNVELVRHKGVEMEIWDVGGADKFRPLLVHYYKGNVMDAIVYIVDSTDRELFPSVRQELRDMAVSEDLVSANLLVLANKTDLKGAVSLQELWDELSLGNLGPGEQPERVNLGFLRATALPICVTSGQGCQEALDWVANVLKTSAWK